MERLVEMFRPQKLDGIVGQPAVEYLQAFIAEPYSKCMAFVGPPGTGKSTAALAIIDALGCRDEFPGHIYRNASEITMDELPSLWNFLQCTFLCPKRDHWHFAILEELSNLSPQAQQWLKSAFEVCLPERAIIVATSNDLSKLQPAVVERFEVHEFPDSPEFRQAAMRRARRIWHHVLSEPFGLEPPTEAEFMAYASNGNGSRFSFRRMLSRIEQRLAIAKHNANPTRVKEAEEYARREYVPAQ
jgi:replication-associated recombination protein RarA